MHSYWEATGGGAHEPAEDLPRAVDVLVVGAGITGHWLAYFLTEVQPSSRVLVVDRALLGGGASTRNAGFLSCSNVSEWLADQRAQGRETALHSFAARLEGIDITLRELGEDLDAHLCGSADLDDITEEKLRLADDLNAYAGRPVFSREMITMAGEKREVLFNSVDHEINPVRLLGCLRAGLWRRGVRFGYGTEVIALGRGRAEARLESRRVTVRYGHAFLCTNAFASELHAASRVQPGRGQILVTAPCDVATTRVLGFLNEGYDYFRFVDGRLLVGGGRHLFRDREATARPEPTVEVRAHLLWLARTVAGTAALDVDYHWAGIMGLPDGGHASVRELEKPLMLDERTEVLAGLGGWGVTLAPYLARKRAERW